TTPQSIALLFHQRPDQRDGAAPHLDDLPSRAQHLPRAPLRRRRPMSGAIPPTPVRLRQRRDVAPIRLHPSLPLAVHRGVIRIDHDHLVARGLERLRHPLTLRPPVSTTTRIAPNPSNTFTSRSRDVDTRCSRNTAPVSSTTRIWLYRM